MREHLRFLGVKVKDRVTGFTGVGTSVSFDLYGCIQTAVQPAVEDKGYVPDGRWFDNNRLEIIGERVLEVPNFAIDLNARDKTGPAAKPLRSELPVR